VLFLLYFARCYYSTISKNGVALPFYEDGALRFNEEMRTILIEYA